MYSKEQQSPYGLSGHTCFLRAFCIISMDGNILNLGHLGAPKLESAARNHHYRAPPQPITAGFTNEILGIDIRDEEL